MIDSSRSASEDTWAADAEDAEEGPTDPHSVDATLASESGTQPSSPTVRHGTFEPGNVVGRYVVLAKLGAGGMGVVYAAYDPELDRKVALKLLLPSRDGDAGQARARLLREAQALAKLAHP